MIIKMEAEQISSLLKAGFKEAIVNVEKVAGHFHITVVTAQFSGLRTVARQQLVYKILGEHISNGSIHAVVMKTYTSDEWSALD